MELKEGQFWKHTSKGYGVEILSINIDKGRVQYWAHTPYGVNRQEQNIDSLKRNLLSVDSGYTLTENEHQIGICVHDWVDTGMQKTWCKKCDINGINNMGIITPT